MNADLKVADRFDGTFVAGARPLIEKLATSFRDVTVDMSDTEQLDASGLDALVYMYINLAPLGYKVRVVGASDRLAHIFENFHIANLFIEEDLAVA